MTPRYMVCEGTGSTETGRQGNRMKSTEDMYVDLVVEGDLREGLKVWDIRLLHRETRLA